MKQGMQQGDADGLCGLYALLNFLASTVDWKDEKPDIALQYLLQSANDHGWLSPHFITKGFEPWQLKRIIDDQFENYRMPYQTFHLSDADRGSGEECFYNFARKITSKGGSILGSPDRSHWLLLTSSKGKMVTVNSADRLKSVKPFHKGSARFDTYGGLIIMPTEAPTVKLD